MKTHDFTAHEVAISQRANNWIPKNVRDLAMVDPNAAKNLLSDLFAEIMCAHETTNTISLNPISLVPELRNAIGYRSDERFAAVFFDNGNRILGKKVYEGGSRTQAALYPRLLFKDAFSFDATGIVLAHNHPGGNCLPSIQDRDLTRRIQHIGGSLEITLIDHLIIAANNHISFREKGWM